MVVLVNRYSASASEIVAACLQDHKRAVVDRRADLGQGKRAERDRVGGRPQRLETHHRQLPPPQRQEHPPLPRRQGNRRVGRYARQGFRDQARRRRDARACSRTAARATSCASRRRPRDAAADRQTEPAAKQPEQEAAPSSTASSGGRQVSEHANWPRRSEHPHPGNHLRRDGGGDRDRSAGSAGVGGGVAGRLAPPLRRRGAGNCLPGARRADPAGHRRGPPPGRAVARRDRRRGRGEHAGAGRLAAGGAGGRQGDLRRPADPADRRQSPPGATSTPAGWPPGGTCFPAWA